METVIAPTEIMLTHQELVEAIIKFRGIREGSWALAVTFGQIAACVPEPNSGKLFPAAITPVLSVGIQRSTQQNNLTVDAARVASPIIIPNAIGSNGK